MTGPARSFCTSAAYGFVARRIVLPWALQGHRPTGDVLEIGTGSGAMAAELLTRYDDVRVVATDYDRVMVDAARHTLAPWAGRATAQQADATELPFADARFSLVLSCAMLHHVVNWERAVAEAIRVLRPGGQLVGFDLLRTLPARFVHGGHHHHGHHDPGIEAGATRLLSSGQLESELASLPVTDVRIRKSVGNLAVRFRATRTDSAR